MTQLDGWGLLAACVFKFAFRAMFALALLVGARLQVRPRRQEQRKRRKRNRERKRRRRRRGSTSGLLSFCSINHSLFIHHLAAFLAHLRAGSSWLRLIWAPTRPLPLGARNSASSLELAGGEREFAFPAVAAAERGAEAEAEAEGGKAMEN